MALRSCKATKSPMYTFRWGAARLLNLPCTSFVEELQGYWISHAHVSVRSCKTTESPMHTFPWGAARLLRTGDHSELSFFTISLGNSKRTGIMVNIIAITPPLTWSVDSSRSRKPLRQLQAIILPARKDRPSGWAPTKPGDLFMLIWQLATQRRTSSSSVLSLKNDCTQTLLTTYEEIGRKTGSAMVLTCQLW